MRATEEQSPSARTPPRKNFCAKKLPPLKTGPMLREGWDPISTRRRRREAEGRWAVRLPWGAGSRTRIGSDGRGSNRHARGAEQTASSHKCHYGKFGARMSQINDLAERR